MVRLWSDLRTPDYKKTVQSKDNIPLRGEKKNFWKKLRRGYNSVTKQVLSSFKKYNLENEWLEIQSGMFISKML